MNLTLNSKDLIERIYDKTIISDLRVRDETSGEIIIGVKRSKYNIRIPKKMNTQIAYIAGIISGDGNFYKCKFKTRDYPRIKLRITSGDIAKLDMINKSFEETFRVGGQIRQHKGKNCYDLNINHKVIWLYFRKDRKSVV